MADHNAHRNHHGHVNPFVPIPPTPRRSAPNSRTGLTDGAVPGDDPYLMEKGTGRPLSTAGTRSRSSSGHGRALALGAGGAALGAAAMHHHNKKNHSLDEKAAVENTPFISRKPVPTKTAGGAPSSDWPYHPPPPVGAAGAISGSPRQSMESARSRPSRDAARANAAFDNEYAHTPETSDDSDHHKGATATALGVGALGGAALAHHHNSNKADAARNSVSPQSAALVASSQQHDSDISNATSNTSSSGGRYYAAPARQASMDGTLHELPSNIPPTPPARERRDSLLGAAAPVAAVGSYFSPAATAQEQRRHSASSSRAASHSRSRSRSNSRPRTFPEHPDDYATHYPRSPHTQQHQYPPMHPDIPVVSSRSPRRRSLAAQEYGEYSPYSTPPQAFPPAATTPFQASPPSPPYESKAIVGDNGYPHHGVPRRKSGGEYDYARNGSLGPQAAPLPFAADNVPARSESISSSGADSWRLSHGMPGGWQRTESAAPRRSAEVWRSPVSPVDAWEAAQEQEMRRGLVGGRMRRPEEATGDGAYGAGVGQAL
jgi:hypothetical protein